MRQPANTSEVELPRDRGQGQRQRRSVWRRWRTDDNRLWILEFRSRQPEADHSVSARTLPSEELPRLLGDLEEVRATALARLVAPPPAHTGPDELIDVQEASRRLGVSTDYLY